MHPVAIEQISDQVLTILWDDNHEGLYFAAHLRKNCPCAKCEEERARGDNDQPFKIIKTRPEDVKIQSWSLVGRYALNIVFSDGHKTGIFTFETLRSLCQCDYCEGKVIKIQGPFRT